jgi:hypothetical protein
MFLYLKHKSCKVQGIGLGFRVWELTWMKISSIHVCAVLLDFDKWIPAHEGLASSLDTTYQVVHIFCNGANKNEEEWMKNGQHPITMLIMAWLGEIQRLLGKKKDI